MVPDPDHVTRLQGPFHRGGASPPGGASLHLQPPGRDRVLRRHAGYRHARGDEGDRGRRVRVDDRLHVLPRPVGDEVGGELGRGLGFPKGIHEAGRV